jgi:hypothetical protein
MALVKTIEKIGAFQTGTFLRTDSYAGAKLTAKAVLNINRYCNF